MKINFLLTECTFLRYFIPLIYHANKKNIKSVMYVGQSNKYTSPRNVNNFNKIKELSIKYNFSIVPIEESYRANQEVFFCIEGSGVNQIHKSNGNKIYSMTYMTDFSHIYDNYISLVDHVIFPSYSFAEKYNKISTKNLYLGSPKYEYEECNNSEIFKKYNLDTKNKIVLYIAPRNRDAGKVNQAAIVHTLKKLDYFVVCKSRRKDIVGNAKLFDMVLYDDYWFPHTTLELLKISDFIINFDSTSIKEAILFKKPIINFGVKPNGIKRLNFLYNYDFCKEIKINESIESQIQKSVELIGQKDYFDEFKECTETHLFNIAGTCDRILGEVL